MIVRLIASALISYVLVLIAGPYLIRYLKKLSFNQNVSEYSLEEFKKKAKTPIMGGLLFIVIPTIVTLVFSAGHLNKEMGILLLSFVGYGAIGFVDDYLIVVKKNNDGLKPKWKFLAQLILAVIFFAVYAWNGDLSLKLLSGKVIHIGVLYAVLILFMFTGASNAVNLTDGMDGLAAGCTLLSLVPYLIFAWRMENTGVAVFITSLIGGLFGYLHYNVKPAKIFMGDVGSLALGAALAAVAMLLKHELSLIVIGMVFVIETLCVIIQQVSVRTIHKRVFPYTPIHYTFTRKGLSERLTVFIFWAASLIFAIIGYLMWR